MVAKRIDQVRQGPAYTTAYQGLPYQPFGFVAGHPMPSQALHGSTSKSLTVEWKP
ncbi:hypothetical protein GCM10027572_17020 [Flexivirga lutea]